MASYIILICIILNKPYGQEMPGLSEWIDLPLMFNNYRKYQSLHKYYAKKHLVSFKCHAGIVQLCEN